MEQHLYAYSYTAGPLINEIFTGTSDTNTARHEFCRETLNDCDHLWIVRPILGASGNDSTFRTLATYSARFPGKIAVICTRTDDDTKDPGLPRSLSDEGCDLTPYNDASKQMRDIEKNINPLQRRVNVLRTQEWSTETRLAILQAEDALKDLRQQLAQVETQCFKFLVSARTSVVVSKISEEMRKHLPEGATPMVPCVSNLHYAGHKLSRKVTGPQLDVKETGIPALRSYAMGIASPLLMAQIGEHAERLTVMVQRLNMWINSTSIENPAPFLEMFRAPQLLMESRFSEHDEHTGFVIDESMGKSLSDNQANFRRVALKRLAAKAKLHHSTFRACIKKYGNHTSRKGDTIERQCWNETFTGSVQQLVL